MQVSLIGLPGSGRTTVFNVLTGAHAETGGFRGAGGGSNIAVVKVPDGRVDALAALFKPRKTTHADVTYVDLPLPAGSMREGSLSAEALGQLRNADALLHVVRAFEDPASPRPADPWGEIEELDLELVMADMAVIQKRLERLATSGRHGTPAEKARNAREEEVLRRLEPALGTGEPLRSVPLDDEELGLLRGFGFLSLKPILLVLNIEESALPQAPALEAEARERYGRPQTDLAVLAPRIEAEIGELDAADAAAFMEELGIGEPSRDRVVRLSYALLGLISFFTAGEDECRAWTVRGGATAVDAAGAIHSDLARGFIRAEVVTFEELVAARSFAEARKRGVLRSEGKTYRVRDGDVINVLFNVSR